MKTLKFLITFFLLLYVSSIYSQDQKILIFDPNNVSASFQSTLSQISNDSVFVADTLDDAIFNYDGLFLFINPPFALSQEKGNRLIQYTSDNKPAYFFTGIFPEGLDTVAFWDHIGIEEMQGLLISVPIDTVFGLSGEFTEGVVIDTSFMSGLIPVIIGNVDSILIGDAEFWEVNTTFISGFDSLNVIIDLYNLIDDYGFLQQVLIHFGLIPPPPITVLSPNGGEYWLAGSTQEISWSSNSLDSVKIELSLINGMNWMTIVESTPSDGNFEWVVEPIQTSHDCKIKISDYSDSTIYDVSDTTFTIDIFPAVDDSTEILLTDFSLEQNYPNPFNPVTSIQYAIGSLPDGKAGRQFVTLKVYDVLGKEVATLVNEVKEPGTYEVEFDATGLTSGIYFYQLREHNFVETKKMLILK